MRLTWLKFRREIASDWLSFQNESTYWDLTGRSLKFIRKNLLGKGMNKGVEHWIEPSDGILRNTNFLDLLASVGIPEIRGIFDFPKNVELISTLIQLGLGKNDICLERQ